MDRSAERAARLEEILRDGERIAIAGLQQALVNPDGLTMDQLRERAAAALGTLPEEIAKIRGRGDLRNELASLLAAHLAESQAPSPSELEA